MIVFPEDRIPSDDEVERARALAGQIATDRSPQLAEDVAELVELLRSFDVQFEYVVHSFLYSLANTRDNKSSGSLRDYSVTSLNWPRWVASLLTDRTGSFKLTEDEAEFLRRQADYVGEPTREMIAEIKEVARRRAFFWSGVPYSGPWTVPADQDDPADDVPF
ncbi:MAG: hypothetical protein JOY99_01580 [Sphingomonadaceae bacterium]|nr:hypothetical protein [Sphingomonadaceae bacterium]